MMTALQFFLAEKDVLLREVHHRVKNNMAAIIGLFDLQRQAMDEPKAQTAMSELSSRVRAMSLVHEKLYRAESLSKIGFDLDTTETLGFSLVRMLGQHQLGGRYEINQIGGTRFTLTFSMRKRNELHA